MHPECMKEIERTFKKMRMDLHEHMEKCGGGSAFQFGMAAGMTQVLELVSPEPHKD